MKRHCPHAPAVIGGFTLLIALLPTLAAAAGNVQLQPQVEALHYVFVAETLNGEDTISARFEYREGDRIVHRERARLSLDGADHLRVPLSPSRHWSSPDATVWIYADDLLLGTFDLASLRAYNQTMDYLYPSPEALARPAAKPFCNSPCGGGCGLWDDYDCDGIANANDSCTQVPNGNQADCDGDGFGDVCDTQNGIYQNAGSASTCMTDKDSQFVYFSYEHHVEQRQTDVSACNSPDIWNRWIADEAVCFNVSDWDCCLQLRSSLASFGDSYLTWCADQVRDYDYCH